MAAEKYYFNDYPQDEPPFLSLQMNSLLRRIKNQDYDERRAHAPLLYQKPRAMCQPVHEALPTFWTDKLTFARDWRMQIEQCVQSFGLHVRTSQNEDTPGILRFLERRYPPELASEIRPFDLYRFRKFGHCILLEDQAGEVMGNVFEVGYHTAEMTSYTIRLAIDEALKGKNLGYHTMIYSALLAMEHGSRVKRGLIQFENLASLHINLNKVGWIGIDFDPDISGLGSFFEIAMPLDPQGLTGNVIDFGQTLEYLKYKRPHYDYRLIAASDQDSLIDLYRKTDFKVAALFKPGMVAPEAQFLALSPEELQLQQG